MASAGKRYPLLVYEHILNRWWPATFTLSAVLAGLWWLTIPELGAENSLWSRFGLLALASIAFLLTLFIFLTRKAAYVRPYPKYLRLSTPFFRLNISYKRLRKTSTAEMHALFPPSKFSAWTRENMSPLMSKTAIVLELNDYPMSRTVLRFFLSSFFFKDKSPNLVILVKDWMKFSTELESLRTGGEINPPKKRRTDNSLLSRLPRA